MILIVFAWLVTASSAAFANTPARQCGTLAPSDTVSGPLTIAGIERQELATHTEILKIRPDYPKLPFGFMNAEWTIFKSRFRSGDTIVRYSTDRRSWKHHAGEAGYALMRSGCLVATFKTMWN
nr:hypothetical protein [Massilia sp. JS1662]